MPETAEPKSPFFSKTILVNLLSFAVMFLVSLTDSELLTNHPDVVAYLLMAVNILNIVLRFLTDKAIAFTKKD